MHAFDSKLPLSVVFNFSLYCFGSMLIFLLFAVYEVFFVVVVVLLLSTIFAALHARTTSIYIIFNRKIKYFCILSTVFECILKVYTLYNQLSPHP